MPILIGLGIYGLIGLGVRALYYPRESLPMAAAWPIVLVIGKK